MYRIIIEIACADKETADKIYFLICTSEFSDIIEDIDLLEGEEVKEE